MINDRADRPEYLSQTLVDWSCRWLVSFALVADEDAQIGLPEMDLGSVHAWGGSARLPRVVFRTYALDIILRDSKTDGNACD